MHTFLTKLGHIWSPANLVSEIPPEAWRYQWLYVGLLGLCLLGIVLLLVLRNVRPNLRERLNNLLWTNLILGGILYFFRVQQIPVFGMDLWRFLQELAIVVWLIQILRFYRKTYRHEALAEEIAARKNKYLPTPKTR